MQTTQKQAKRAGLLGLALLLTCLFGATSCMPAADQGPIVNGQYSFPMSVAIYNANPSWFSGPHHDYPAADIPVGPGTNIVAIAGGTVVKAPVGGSCGFGVIIDGFDGHRYTYCHGSYETVTTGMKVNAGTRIMVSGYSGTVFPAGPGGAHLHLQIQLNRGNGPLVCPQSALAAWARGHAVNVAALPTSNCSY